MFKKCVVSFISFLFIFNLVLNKLIVFADDICKKESIKEISSSIENSKVTGIRIIESSKNSIKLGWDAMCESDGYEIYRGLSKYGDYSLIGIISDSSTLIYEDEGLKADKYYYKVRAYKDTDDGKIYSQYCILSAIMMHEMGDIQVTNFSYNSNELKWDKIEDANGYEVYRSDSIDGEYDLIATTYRLSYIDRWLPPETKYYYKVRAYKYDYYYGTIY